jgi:hypothetical protein
MDEFTEGMIMRNLLLAGTAGLFVALGAANAYAVPQNSPYATMVPPGAVDGYAPDDSPVYGAPLLADPMVEGRSAYVDPDSDYVDPGYGYGYGYGYGGPAYFGGGGGGFYHGGGHHGGGMRHGR